MAEFQTLFSSSSGNCEYVSDGRHSLLIDAGVSCKRILAALEALGKNKMDLLGVLVTHEHSDHVKGISVLCRKLGIPVYANQATAQAMEVPKKEGLDIRLFENGKTFALGEMEITPFAIPHDAASPVGFRFHFPKEGVSLGSATDMGCVTGEVHKALEGCDGVFIESNHDRNMLLTGGYPYYLKRRILSDRGHLCNDDCGELAAELVKKGTRHLVLGHLSRENNLPDIAYMAVQQQLARSGAQLEEDYTLSVAPSDRPGELIAL